MQTDGAARGDGGLTQTEGADAMTPEACIYVDLVLSCLTDWRGAKAILTEADGSQSSTRCVLRRRRRGGFGIFHG